MHVATIATPRSARPTIWQCRFVYVTATAPQRPDKNAQTACWTRPITSGTHHPYARALPSARPTAELALHQSAEAAGRGHKRGQARASHRDHLSDGLERNSSPTTRSPAPEASSTRPSSHIGEV